MRRAAPGAEVVPQHGAGDGGQEGQRHLAAGLFVHQRFDAAVRREACAQDVVRRRPHEAVAEVLGPAPGQMHRPAGGLRKTGSLDRGFGLHLVAQARAQVRLADHHSLRLQTERPSHVAAHADGRLGRGVDAGGVRADIGHGRQRLEVGMVGHGHTVLGLDRGAAAQPAAHCAFLLDDNAARAARRDRFLDLGLLPEMAGVPRQIQRVQGGIGLFPALGRHAGKAGLRVDYHLDHARHGLGPASRRALSFPSTVGGCATAPYAMPGRRTSMP